MSFNIKQFLKVRGTDKVCDVKERVIEAINGSSGKGKGKKASPDTVVLFHKQQQCVDYTELDSGHLGKFEVKPYDYLYYVWYKSFADAADISYQGKKRRIYGTSPQETVFSLKLKIQDQLGIPVNAQKLYVPGLIDPQLDDTVGTLENLRV